MKGQINSTFGMLTRDMFESGLAAEIGAGPMLVWLAIKHHSDYTTGSAHPGIRRLCEVTGLTDKTVMAHIDTLIAAHLLRIDQPGNRRRSTRYTPMERMDVRLGDRLLCRVCIDYAPAQLQKTLRRIEGAVKTGKPDPDAWVGVMIVPGPGFVWDPSAGVLRGQVARADLPDAPGSSLTPEDVAGALLGLEKAYPVLKRRPRKTLVEK